MDITGDNTSRGGISTKSSSSKAEPVKKNISNSSVESVEDPTAVGPIQKGDLYWSQIGSFPYWPCIVTPDPENQEISSKLNHAGQTYKAYHVRFFGDKGSRSWVKNSKLIPYEGRSAFDDKMKSVKNKSIGKLYKKGLKSKSWHIAIQEADLINNCQPENRIMEFENILELEISKKEAKKIKAPAKLNGKKGSKKASRKR